MEQRATLRLFSYSHQNTPLDQRDRLAYSHDQIRKFLPLARERFGGEHAVLSTCNRTEFYYWGPDEDDLWAAYRKMIVDFKDIDPEAIGEPEDFRGTEAARHIFRVAASLESLALGENEILGQVKEAHQLLLDSDHDGSVLDELFQYAIRAGKEIRTDTELCEGSVSVSSVAVDLASKIFGNLGGRTVMLVGAGETAETAAEHFQEAGVSDLVVVNRSRDTGRQLADRFDGDYLALDELDSAIVRADVAVVATGSQEPLVTREMLEGAMEQRKREPMFLIDISNPRNVEPSCADMAAVYLYNMDDLQQAVEANLASREDEIPKAEAIVDEYTDRWDDWVQQLKVTPTISTLAQYFEDMRQQELDRLHGEISEEERSRIEAFSKALVKKLLHHPIRNLRSAVDDGSLTAEQIELVWSLYNLQEFERETDEN
ncbi:MAG: glutamyl-tRNA reductase [Bradymonadaceae bacterium]